MPRNQSLREFSRSFPTQDPARRRCGHRGGYHAIGHGHAKRSALIFSTTRNKLRSRVTLNAYLRKDPQPLDITTSLLYCLLFMAPSLYLAVDSARWMDLSQLAFCPARPLRLVPIPVGNSTANHSSMTGISHPLSVIFMP